MENKIEFTPYRDQIFDKLKASSLESGKLFEDPEFPATDKSLFKFNKQHNVTWKRAKEICKDPQFIVNGISPNDLDQGTLGDCWLISSIAAVAQVPEYINRVVPNDQSFNDGDYAGIFHFRIWQFGYWFDVVVDDYLPIDQYGRIAFCHNNIDKNEMFGSLLEKAFAKVNVCYEFIGNGGQSMNALMDLTGGVHETYNIKSVKNHGIKVNIKKNALWEMMIRATSMNSIMGAPIDSWSGRSEEDLPNGLITGHAYSIFGAYEIFKNSSSFDTMRTNFQAEPSQKDSIKLLKMRNPWGTERQDWKGDFCINSAKWKLITDEVKTNIDCAAQDGKDGIFFISLDDFMENFHRIHFLHVNIGGLSVDEKHDDINYHWESMMFKGEWVKGKNSGGCGNGDYAKYWTNPQYNISLKLNNNVDDKVSVIIDLTQTELIKRKLQRKKKEEAISFSIYKVLDKDGISKKRIESGKRFEESQLEEVGSTTIYLATRQVCRRFNLPAGDYVVIPSCFESEVDMKYLLRVFVEGSDQSEFKACKLNKRKHKKIDDEVVVPVDETTPEEPKIVRESSIIGQQQSEVILGKDVEISDEYKDELDEEWRKLEEDWNKVSNMHENDPEEYRIIQEKEIEYYESDGDDYSIHDDEVYESGESCDDYMLGDDDEDEYLDPEKPSSLEKESTSEEKEPTDKETTSEDKEPKNEENEPKSEEKEPKSEEKEPKSEEKEAKENKDEKKHKKHRKNKRNNNKIDYPKGIVQYFDEIIKIRDDLQNHEQITEMKATMKKIEKKSVACSVM